MPDQKPQAASEAAPLPDSLDPVELAMSALADDRAPDNPTRELIANQNRLVRAEIAQLARLRWRDYIITAFGLLLLVLVALFVWRAASSRAVVVQPFDAPPSLADRGVSGQVLAGSVQDSIATIQAINLDAATARNIDNAWTDDIAIEVPTTGVSITEMDRLLRRWLGRETYVGGALVRNTDGTLSLTIRATGVPPGTFTGPEADLAGLSTRAAEYIYGRFEPRLFSRYLIQQDRVDDALAFVPAAYARGPAGLRSALATTWASALDLKGRQTESAAKNRLAIELDPENWIAASNLIGTLYNAEGEESAAREGRRLQQRLRTTSHKPGAGLNPLQNYQPLVEDWTGFIEGQLRSLEATGGKGSLAQGNVNLYLSDAETYRHDWRAAERFLTAGANGSADFRAQGLLNRGLQALEAGDLTRAIAALERFDTLWQRDQGLQWTFYFHPCYLGLAYGLAGRTAEANAVFDRMAPWSHCATYRADTIEAGGDHAAADTAFAAAVRLAPSLPRPYQHWGLALLRRGDLAGARAKFAAAHQRGPRWADPLKSLGDVAMRQGDWQRATRFYARARPFAPGWRALADASRAADAKVAAMPRWRRWLGRWQPSGVE